jgi:dolichyl-phosphate-mannose--protein O-mannosyl transferase
MMTNFVEVLLICCALWKLVASSSSSDPVTCGSTIKLINTQSKHHLNSHAIAWGSGSGQQSVTTLNSQSDPNALWVIKESVTYLKGTKTAGCELGMPIKCGDKIRLEHIGTGKNLHSHLFKAPLSGNQEVSGYGDRKNSDTGDNWFLQCKENGVYWERGQEVNLVHVDTSRFLTSESKSKFTAQNCGQGCPIMDQNEVSASTTKGPGSNWKTGQGVYFPVKDAAKKNDDNVNDDEL